MKKGFFRVAVSHTSHREVLQVSCILSTKGISISLLNSSDVFMHHKRTITDYKKGSGSDSPNTDVSFEKYLWAIFEIMHYFSSCCAAYKEKLFLLKVVCNVI